MAITYSYARSSRQHHPSRIYRWGLHYPQKSSCPPKSLSNPPSSTSYFFAAPISTPALCLLFLPHHPIKHLSVLFPVSYTLPPAGLGSPGMSSMVLNRNRQHKPLPYSKPSSHPSAALQSSFPGAPAEEPEVPNPTGKEKPHMYCKIRPCTEQFPQGNYEEVNCMKTSEGEVLDHSETGMFTAPPKDSLCPPGIHSVPPHIEKLPRAVPSLGIEVPLNKHQEQLQRGERKQRQYLVSLSSCCMIRLL